MHIKSYLMNELWRDYEKNSISLNKSPVDPSIGRNKYADSLSQVAGVKTFLNLADGKDNAESYNGYAESYYATQNVVYLGVQPTFANTQFKVGLVKGLRYMIEHEGPYLVM